MTRESRAGWLSYLYSVLILTSLALLPYLNILQTPFQFDAVPHIKSNPYLINFIEKNDSESFFWQYPWNNISNRPFLNYTYAANYFLGKTNTFGYLLVNIQIHLCVVLLIYLIARQVFAANPAAPEDARKKKVNLPLLTAMLFAVHPLHTESITYIISRSSSLSTLLYLLAFYCFIRIFKPDRSSTTAVIMLGLAIIVLLRIAIGVKLIVISFPFIAFAYYALFTPGGERCLEWLRRRPVPTALATAVITAAVVSFLVLTDTARIGINDAATALFGRTSYLLSQLQWSVFYYLKTILFPFGLNADPDLERIGDWLAPGVLAGTFCILALGYGFYRASLFTWFGFLWYAVTLGPESSIIPLLDLVAEHRMYLPGLGMALIAAVLIGKRRFAAALPLILICLAASTLDRNTVWRTEISLWRDTAQKGPHKARTFNNYARALVMAGKQEEALAIFEKAILLDTTIMETYHNLGNLHMQMHNCPKAVEAHLKALALAPNVADSYLVIGQCYKMEGKTEEAISALKQAAGLDPTLDDAFVELGMIHYFYLKKTKEGLFYFKQALRIRPDHPSAQAMQNLIANESANPSP